MDEIQIKRLARTIMTSLPVDAPEFPSFRGFYAADNRVPDWEQRLAAIVASSPAIISSVAMVSEDWLLVAAVMSDRADMVIFLDKVQELAAGQPGDPTLPCMLAVAG